jgi:hypothetical protein
MKIKRYLFLALLIICCSSLTFSTGGGNDQEINKKKTFEDKKANPVGLDDTPVVFAVFQNSPNPFNPVTVIKFSLPDLSIYSFKVYDMTGREIFSTQGIGSKGSHEIRFDGSNLSSGIYFYTVQTDKYTATKKMILVK